jgi:NADH-quinone oxidoreductase subunit L
MAGTDWAVDIGLHFDRLTAVMLTFILGVGTFIHLYAVGYMADDRGFTRFFAYFNLFIFFMVALVLADNAILTFLGWEGVGLCSYLLIGFWHKDPENVGAAKKAFVVNRIGDLGLLVGLFALAILMYQSTGSFSFDWVDISRWASDQGVQTELLGAGLLTVAVLCIFLGCAGKSAQIPLFTWLPDAMAGPTPVSALIHAATMVTAGIYLCSRFADLLVLSPIAMNVILILAIATALYAAVMALFQWDIKKILAYSTVSQLGFMFMAVGVGAFDVAIFHVFTHAFFKAALFMGAGSVIHALHHEQDIRRMGGLDKKMPETYSAMFFSWYAIIGLPLGSGFMSKDLILERLVIVPGLGYVFYAIAVVAALLTAIYMTRLMYYVFWSPSRRSGPHAEPHALPLAMIVPPLFIGFLSLIVGVVWVALIPGVNFLERWLSPVFESSFAFHHDRVYEGELPHSTVKAIILALVGTAAAVVGALIARKRFAKGPCDPKAEGLSSTGAAVTFAFDIAYYKVIVAPLLRFSRSTYQIFDEIILPGIIKLLTKFAQTIGFGYQRFQRSRMRSSLAISLVGMVIILGVVLADMLGLFGKGL